MSNIHRAARLKNLIFEEISKILSRDLDLPAGVIVTVTSVDLSQKKDRATIGLSIFPESNAVSVLAVLKAQTKSINWQLIKKLDIRFTPDISFIIDDGGRNAANVEKLLFDK